MRQKINTFQTIEARGLSSYLLQLLFLVACSLLIVLVQACSVNAAPGNMAAPFDTGSSWNVCQGYENTRGTHNGTSRLSLDLTGAGCDNSASGKNIRAPFTGTVSWYVGSSGSMCVSAPDGRSVMLTHIDALVAQNTGVVAGDLIGVIAAPGYRQNNGVAHLHLQAWSSTRCSNNNDQVPFDAGYGTRICGAPNLPSPGPNTFNNGVWGSTKFTAEPCSQTSPASPTVYRFYSPTTRHHLFTTDVNEHNVLRSNQSWNFEGSAYWAKSTSGCSAEESVYRLYSEKLKLHLYTTDENEKNVLSGYPPEVWKYESVAFCAARTADATNKPVYRFYSEPLTSYLYTTDESEKSELMKHPATWRYEGVAYYAYTS